MKNLLIVLGVVFFINSCIALDIAEVFTEPTPIHYAEIQRVTKTKNTTILSFVDGYSYEIINPIHVKPGDTVKIFQEAGGNFKAIVEN